jgi:hypothetical protein
MAESYKGGLDPWEQLYAGFFQARGLPPRPGITVDDIASILSACSGGVALRTLGDPSSEVIDHNRQRSILGTAALAVI